MIEIIQTYIESYFQAFANRERPRWTGADSNVERTVIHAYKLVK